MLLLVGYFSVYTNMTGVYAMVLFWGEVTIGLMPPTISSSCLEPRVPHETIFLVIILYNIRRWDDSKAFLHEVA